MISCLVPELKYFFPHPAVLYSPSSCYGCCVKKIRNRHKLWRKKKKKIYRETKKNEKQSNAAWVACVCACACCVYVCVCCHCFLLLVLFCSIGSLQRNALSTGALQRELQKKKKTMLVFLKVFNRLLLHAAAVSSRKTKPLNNETVFAKKRKST